jgi:hypothetical protein
VSADLNHGVGAIGSFELHGITGVYSWQNIHGPILPGYPCVTHGSIMAVAHRGVDAPMGSTLTE